MATVPYPYTWFWPGLRSTKGPCPGASSSSSSQFQEEVEFLWCPGESREQGSLWECLKAPQSWTLASGSSPKMAGKTVSLGCKANMIWWGNDPTIRCSEALSSVKKGHRKKMPPPHEFQFPRECEAGQASHLQRTLESCHVGSPSRRLPPNYCFQFSMAAPSFVRWGSVA